MLEDRPGSGPAVVFRGRTQQFDVPGATVARAARSAVRAEETVRQEARDRTGGPVRLLAVPFYHDATDEVAGAAVAVGDPEYGAAEHRSLVLSLVIGCAALTALAALTGHVLSGRSMRPAWQALEQQERLLADAAHELRTPVAVMRGSVEVAERGPGGLQAHLPRIRRAADRMGHVVENLLTRGRLEAAVESVRAEPLRLDQLVEEVCADLPEGGHRLELRLEESVVEADAALVRVAVRNLLDNAVRHGHAARGGGPGRPSRGRARTGGIGRRPGPGGGARAAAGADGALPLAGRRYGHRPLAGAPGGPRPSGQPDRADPDGRRCGVRAAARARPVATAPGTVRLPPAGMVRVALTIRS